MPLTEAEKMKIINVTSKFEGKYWSINADGEFEGKFGNHPAKGKYHVGISWGFIQFTQDSGSLGKVLKTAHAADATKFKAAFGPSAEKMLEIVNRSGASSRKSPGGRSARVQPVDGADLWKAPWHGRFTAAGKDPFFQEAQRKIAMSNYFNPILPTAKKYGIKTARGLSVLFDRCVQMGAGGMRSFVKRALGESRPAGMTDKQIISKLADAAKGAFWAHRLRKIRDDPDMGDAAYTDI